MNIEDRVGLLCGTDVRIADTVIWKRPSFAILGSHIAIDDYCVFTTGIRMGNFIHVAPMCSVIGGADGMFTMGNFTTMAVGCRVIVRGDAHMGAGLVSPVIPDQYRDDVIGEKILMMDYSALGSNVVIMPNVWLAEGVVVGANSLVTKPITEPWTVWIGSPARKLKDRPKDKMIQYGKELLG